MIEIATIIGAIIGIIVTMFPHMYMPLLKGIIRNYQPVLYPPEMPHEHEITGERAPKRRWTFKKVMLWLLEKAIGGIIGGTAFAGVAWIALKIWGSMVIMP